MLTNSNVNEQQNCRKKIYLSLKRPSHDKLKFANSCWQTLKSWQTHAFTRQTRVNSKHTPICNMADIVQWHSQRRVAACVLLLFCVKRRKKRNFVHERGVKSECKKLYLPPFKFSFSAICSINFCLRFVSL